MWKFFGSRKLTNKQKLDRSKIEKKESCTKQERSQGNSQSSSLSRLSAHWSYLVWLWGILVSFQLHLQTFCANLETVHRLNCCVRWRAVVERHKTETFTQIRLLINEHLCRHNMAEWHESWCKVSVRELLRQMVDEQITTVRSLNLLACCLRYSLSESWVAKRWWREWWTELWNWCSIWLSVWCCGQLWGQCISARP